MRSRTPLRLLIVALIVIAATGTFGLEGAAKKAKKRKPVPKITPVPTPTPIPFQRAAGSCLRYEANQYVIVAELGQAGRVFRIDADTVIRVPKLKTGNRVRVLFEDSPEGPVARRILPGPEPVTAK
ncbi:MAG: hypothetical protein ABIT01_16525 [Thermoanaerobaculia bacterium]